MAHRSEQQYALVAGERTQDGSIQVRRIYADVLIQTTTAGTIEKTLTSTLTLSDDVHAVIEERSFEDTLGFTQEVSYIQFNEDQEVLSTIVFTQDAVGARDRYFSVSDTIVMFSLGGRTHVETPSSTLNMADLGQGFNLVGDRQPVGNTLSLTQSVTTLSDLSITQSLGLTDEAIGRGAIYVAINHWLAIAQHSSTPYRMWFEDELGLSQFVRSPLPIEVSINHALTLVDDVQPFGVIDTLTLTQSVTFGKGYVVEQSMNITDEMEMTGLWIRTVGQDLGIGHALTWYEDTPCGKKQYTPFQGENTITTDVVAPSDTLADPQGSTSDRFSLYQPVLGVHTSEVTLRAPELDNRDRNAYNRVSSETRGGTLIVYADPNWPKIRTLAVTITGITETQVDELQVFLQDTIGQLIGLTDWEGRLWSGFITNPNEVATQDGKGRWTVTLEMEGEMLDVEQPGNDDGNGMALDLTDSVGVDSGINKWFVDDVNLSDAATGVIV